MSNVGLQSVFKAVKLAGAAIGEMLFPAVCVNCNISINSGDNGLCRRCWGEIFSSVGSDYCSRCGRDASLYARIDGACPNCRDEQIHFDGIVRCGVYGDAMRGMILAFKSTDKVTLDSALGSLADSALQGSRFYDDIDSLVPVPLHWRRRIRRGYNQSAILADKLRHPRAKVNSDLVRIRHTPMQATLNRAKREANVSGAFAVRREHQYAGRTTCLVDDIKTSGATLNECAKTIKAAGAKKVYALVLAVAGQHAKP
jgi:competence protein ComFC